MDKETNLREIVFLGVLIFLGWVVVSILPVILPYIGYAFVGLLAIGFLSAIFGK